MTIAFLYGPGYVRLMTPSDIDWVSDTIKLALLASSYTPDQDAHDFFDDVSGHEVSGTGYTAGGQTIANRAVVYDGGTNQVQRKGDPVEWDPSTITARYAVVYKDTGTASTSPLIMLVNFESDQSSSGGPFTVSWSPFDIIALTTLA